MVRSIDLTEGRRPRGKGPAWNSLPPKVEIIAIDPGGTTGWSFMSIRPEALIEQDVAVLDNIILHTHGQVDCGGGGNVGGANGDSYNLENAGISDLIWFMRENPGAFVIIEDFVLRQMNQARHLLSPVRIGKVLEWWLYTQGRNYTYQSVSLAKTTASDERLKIWKGRSCPDGMYFKDGLQHARDADRHILTFLRRAREVGVKGDKLRQESWPHLFSPGRPYGVEE